MQIFLCKFLRVVFFFLRKIFHFEISNVNLQVTLDIVIS